VYTVLVLVPPLTDIPIFVDEKGNQELGVWEEGPCYEEVRNV
jgi:hypothetical protein